jgi:hypothetical protein
MMKVNEILDQNSCFNSALPKELIFVLLERDLSAPVAIRAWVEHRVMIGKNKFDDAQIREAIFIAELMEKEQKEKQKTQ